MSDMTDGPEHTPAPADTRRTVRVLFTLDRAYLPMFCVVAGGVFGHRDPARSYELIVISDDITQLELDGVASSTVPGTGQAGSFSYRLVSLGDSAARLEGAFPGEGFPSQVLFRLLAPQLLPDVDRVVYLDCDLVVLDDVAKLYDQDLDGALVGACLDPGMAGMVGGYDPAQRTRLREDLGMGDPGSYFCSGVLLWDLAATRAQTDPGSLLDFVRTHRLRFGDQDALNHEFQGDRLRLLDMRWDVLYDSEGIRVSKILPHAPAEVREQYLRARRDPAIFHYAGPFKPWQRRVDGSELFWRAARGSACYEDLLALYAANVSRAKDEELMGKVWKTFDDLYFRASELERVQHDLHLRVARLEQRAGDLERRTQKLAERRETLSGKLMGRVHDRGEDR